MTTECCSLLIDFYNEALSDIDRERFLQHLNECEACQEELKELDELTKDLPFLAEPVSPPQGMKKRVLNAVFADEQENVQTTKPPVEVTQLRRKRPSRRSWLSYGLAACLLLSLIGNAFAVNSGLFGKDQVAKDEDIAKVLNTVAFKPSEAMDMGGSAAIIKSNGEINLIVQANHLKQLAGSEVYQVWLIDDDKPYRAGTFVPDSSGGGAVTFPVAYNGDHQWDAVAISLEPNSNSQTPKGKVYLSATL